MQSLELVEDRFQDLIDGKKTDTIRLDEGDVVPGLLLYVSFPSGERRAVVEVTEVANIPLRQVADRSDDIERRPTNEVVLRRMRRHYPQITLDTEVLYVRHRTVSETLERFPEEVSAILDGR